MGTYRRLFAYVRPYRARLVWSLLFGGLLSGTTALAALLVKPVLDQIFIERDTTKLLFFPLVIVLLYVVRGMFYYAHAYLMRAIGQRVIYDLRDQLFAHLQRLSLGTLQSHHTGTLVSRVVSDITLVERAVTSVVNDIIRQSLTMLALLGVALYRDWLLAAYAMVILPLASLMIMWLGRRLRLFSRRAQEHLAELSALLTEVFSSMKIVKGFGREAYEQERFQQRNTAYYRVAMRAARADELGSPFTECLAALGIAAVVWHGGHQVMIGATTPGTFFSFLTAVFMLYEPMRKLSRVNSVIQAALAAATRVFSVLDTPHEWAQEEQKPALPRLTRSITFSQVSLRYHPDGPDVLQEVSLEVAVGEVVAFVGMSGAGKTSLVHLLPRFYDPTRGVIAMDGHNIRDVSLGSLRAQMSIVSQDVLLFDDTLRQNIRYGDLQASDSQVEAAARAAYAHDFIMSMPQAYDTVIGERGMKLSGGEKQRIAMARALLRNAPLLILDEATSALDSASEQMVQYALLNLMKDRTTFVIAHRLSTIRHADKIVVMHAGRIVEVGRHDVLLAHHGMYSRLYQLQFQNQDTVQAPLPAR